MPDDLAVFDAAGGMPFFRALVDRFYDGVAGDEVLRPLYPSELEPSRRHLSLFLAQYWGGPPDYDEQRGPPQLRLRHVPFAIGPIERDHWLHHMRAAIGALDPPADVAAALHEYFDVAAEAMRNRD
ncbi:MAG TPA: globin [Actinomycetota bacterium]|nr:globin [Actinomycetota bacterium]